MTVRVPLAACNRHSTVTPQMRKGAMEAALQQEVTAHAAAKAHNGLLQACVANLMADLQEQHSSETAWRAVDTGMQEHGARCDGAPSMMCVDK